jgi:hypothetical protein
MVKHRSGTQWADDREVKIAGMVCQWFGVKTTRTGLVIWAS